jgi:hypothetical protein
VVALPLVGFIALAGLFLRAVVDVSATYGSNYPASGYSSMAAFWMEFILTLGLTRMFETFKGAAPEPLPRLLSTRGSRCTAA